MSGFRFKPWRRFGAKVNQRKISAFLRDVGREAEKAFKRGMRSAKSGKLYTGRSGRKYRASAPGQYPARDTGDLEASIATTLTEHSVTIGTQKFYGKFLREGTRYMARRKMSDAALTEGVQTARHRLKGWVEWKRM